MLYKNLFPNLHHTIENHDLVYFDNGASSQMPYSVVEAIDTYHTGQHANVHRGVHYLSTLATNLFEKTRTNTAQWLNANHESEIIFTSGTTEGINLVAYCYAEVFMKAGDEIILSYMEHHANIVPWQLVAERHNLTIRVINVTEDGTLDIDHFLTLLSPKTKMVAVAHVSNVLGTINDVQRIINLSHAQKVPVLLDGAQYVPHHPLDVQKLDCDFYTFSPHKIYGPTGIGILYGKKKWLEAFKPYKGGGEMIKHVSFSGTTFNELPHKLEAGTPPIAACVGFGAAIDFIKDIGYDVIQKKEDALLNHGLEVLRDIPDLILYGHKNESFSCTFAFNIQGLHSSDIGILLDKYGIAIRTGHHCAQPLHENILKIDTTARISLSFYNTIEEIDYFKDCLIKVIKILKT